MKIVRKIVKESQNELGGLYTDSKIYKETHMISQSYLRVILRVEVKVDGPNPQNWTVQTPKSGRFRTTERVRSTKVDGPQIESGRSDTTESGRSEFA